MLKDQAIPGRTEHQYLSIARYNRSTMMKIYRKFRSSVAQNSKYIDGHTAVTTVFAFSYRDARRAAGVRGQPVKSAPRPIVIKIDDGAAQALPPKLAASQP